MAILQIRGLIVSNRDEKIGRQLHDRLKQNPRVMSIGRLGLDLRGIILLMNDGDLRY